MVSGPGRPFVQAANLLGWPYGGSTGADSREGLEVRGVGHLFTLSGGHLFSIYDGCKEEGIGIVDVRHEQTAVFAAEGFAKATRGGRGRGADRRAGVTNGLSAIAGAQANGSPLCVLGGRAPEMRWGSGSLQEIDHLPVRLAAGQVGRDRQGAGRDRGDDRGGAGPGAARPGGPTFVDYPLDVVFTEAEAEIPPLPEPVAAAPPAGVEEAAALLAAAERPAIMAGSGLYWGHGEEELRALAEALGIPVFLNGLGRGCLPADHELAFSRARGAGLEGRRRGARGRRADGLPARLRRQLRRGDEDRPARRRARTR